MEKSKSKKAEKPVTIKKSRIRAGHSCQSCNKLKTVCSLIL